MYYNNNVVNLITTRCIFLYSFYKSINLYANINQILIKININKTDIGKVFSGAGYIFPAGKKVTSTKNLTIDERLHIALGRIYNKATGEDGISRKELAHLFDEFPANITNAASGKRNLSRIKIMFKYLFKQTGLPYKDLEAPEPGNYQKDLPATLRKYKHDYNI